ncbi:RDD family protein [Streptomyces sp. NPDC090445]|uniref:RDD family protein n=1 Tax=Streptomyces sp. NPDC090445 TaxID=3365963 RepID=UPI00380E11FA
MSTDQPPPEQPPEDDPFRKRPEGPPPPSNGTPPGGPYGGGPGGSGYPPPPPPYGGGDPFGSGSGSGMPDPLAGMPPLADFGRRLGARIIDVIIVAVPLFFIFGLAVDIDWYRAEGDEASRNALTAGLIAIAAFVLYDWWFHQKSGQTLGKKMLGLRVAMLNDGSVPAAGPALTRAAMIWVPGLICCWLSLFFWSIALVISMLVDKPYRQGLHDKIAKTVVVRTA